MPSSSGSFTGRYERARRALRAERRTALLGFPLPAAQRIDARYEKTYRAVAEKSPYRKPSCDLSSSISRLLADLSSASSVSLCRAREYSERVGWLTHAYEKWSSE